MLELTDVSKLKEKNDKGEKLTDVIQYPTDTTDLNWHLFENGSFVEKSIVIKTNKT